MNLENKKALVARTLGVGKNKVIFNRERLTEIQEALTKQDIRDLVQSKAIHIRDPQGRARKEKRKTRRRTGSVKKKVSQRKRTYVLLTRKFRSYVFELKKQGVLTNEQYHSLRKEIRQRTFKDKTHLKERIQEIKKQ